jgi:hypothetical protein
MHSVADQMRRGALVAICAAALILLAAGCGSSGSGTNGSMTGSTPGGSTTTTPDQAIKSPIQERGIKGENPTTEAASTKAISTADCVALAKLAEERLGAKLTRRPTPKPPLSRCRLEAPGISINVFLDAAFAAHQRYENRIEETVQFNTENPAGLPKPVPHVGEKAAYNSDASWIPALRSLLAVRGNRWLTVTISIGGKSDKELLAEASALAIEGFRLTAR